MTTRFWFRIGIFLLALGITGKALDFLCSEKVIRNTLEEGINYDAFRELRVSSGVIEEVLSRMENHQKKKSMPTNETYPDTIGYLTFNMLANEFDLVKNKLISERTFLRGRSRLEQRKGYIRLYGYYEAILSDLRCFPVPSVDGANPANTDISFVDTWSELRKYGGKRRHEGTDIMAKNNLRGYYPIISITDGTVEKLGWLDKGGYRVGIRAPSGAYFYYAHLYSYAPGLSVGDNIIAGQLLGFMGDSGYGKEGTVGQFDVHLHLGIYVQTEAGEMSVNPYALLRMLEKNRSSVIQGKPD
jgi:murein DD-endopeptidase MepM/ murein hydrolase activator NlpD